MCSSPAELKTGKDARDEVEVEAAHQKRRTEMELESLCENNWRIFKILCDALLLT